MKKPSKDIKLSIVIPVYNEGRILDGSLKQLADFLNSNNMMDTTEVVCAVTYDGDDKSLDISKKYSKQIKNLKVLDLGKRIGKGGTVAKGMMASSGEYRMFMDADLATPLHHIDEMLNCLEHGSEVAIGIRDIRSMHSSLARMLMSVATNRIVRLIAARGINDTQCGFKGFSQEAADRIFTQQKITGWGFDIEVIAMSRAFKYHIDEIYIRDWSDPKGSEGLVGDSQLQAMYKTFKELIKIRMNLWLKKYR